MLDDGDFLKPSSGCSAKAIGPAAPFIWPLVTTEEAVSSGGAQQVAELLKSRGIQPELTLDEGLSVARGLMPGVQRPVALIGMGEKGFVNIEVEVSGAGGHSSMPPKQTLVGKLARALTRLEEHQMPVELADPWRPKCSNLSRPRCRGR